MSIWRPYTQEKTSPPSVKLSHASGAYLFTDSGQKILDGISSWWLVTHGHCHPRIVKAISRQAARLDQVTFANFTHEPAEELNEVLVRLMPPELGHIFFSDNGSTAVEVALKMALQSREQGGFPQKNKFLSFAKAYHGDTVGAMSVSGRSTFNRRYERTLFQTIQVQQPTDSTATVAEFVADFERQMSLHHTNLAAVIIEPLVQGAGGMIMWPVEALQQIVRRCRAAAVLVIFDEVMTGFGRTGPLFAMEKLGICPDILCLSKGLTGGSLPLAITISSQEIYQSFSSEDQGRMLFHGHSFTGNPLACAAALENLRIFQEETSSRGAIEIIHGREIKKLSEKFPIGDPRVCGTIAAFDVLKNKDQEREGYLSRSLAALTGLAMERGLFIRPLGDTLYLMPPYCIDENELVSAWQIIDSLLHDLPWEMV